MTQVFVDASDFAALARAFHGVPGEIRTKVLARAMRRVRDMAKTRVVRRSADHVQVPQKHVRKATTATFNAGSNTVDIVVDSGWIPLFRLGALQTRKGVTVRLRGSYRHAFLAQMDSGHRGVFRRVPGTRMQDKNREQIRELFGPNPAHAVINNPAVYEQTLAEVLDQVLLPRVVHELDRIMPGRG